MKKIETIGVVGSGKMGCGIAQVCCEAGYNVVVADQNKEIVQSAIKSVRKYLEKLADKGKIDKNSVEGMMSKVVGVDNVVALSDCDIVIEAVFEDMDVKKNVLKELDSICDKDTIIGSNTSSLCISKLGSDLKDPSRLVGMHFFNPVPSMALVEVVKTVNTSTETESAAIEFVKSIKKKPVIVRDQAGFVVNLILTPFLFDAVRAVSDGVCTVVEMDNSMRYGCGHPMGPLALCDFIGLDILVSAGNAMFEEYHEKKYAPPPLLKRLVDVGDYGMKTGRGFYDYGTQGTPVPRAF